MGEGKMKKAYSYIMIVIMLCSLSGCGKSEENVQVLNTTQAEPVYLSFFANQNMGGSDMTKYWSEQFMEQYNKQVYINFEGAFYYEDEGLSYRELLEKRLSSSSPDDLYIINAEDVLEFEKNGYWMDLSELDFVDNLSEAALYQSTYNGKIFSLPLSFTGFGMVWNVSMLEDHGLQVPGNIEEFWHVCKTLKEAGILPYGGNKGYALTVPAMCAGFSSLYGAQDQEEKIAALNSGETPVSTYMRSGYEFLYEMIEKGYMDPEQALAATPCEEDLELLASGECAFICAGLDIMDRVDDSEYEFIQTGVPLLSDGTVAVYGATSRLCVNPKSANLKTALDFIEMLGTPEALEKSAELDAGLSSAKGGDINEFSRAEELASLLQQPGQIPNQDFTLYFNTWESIRDVGRELCGGASVDEACAMLDEKQKTEIENYTGK